MLLTSVSVFTLVLYSFTLINEVVLREVNQDDEFLLVTVATNETDGYKRFLRSTKVYGIPVTVLGLGQEWKGGNMNKPGGSHKVNLLKKELEKYKNLDKMIIMFTDSYDVIITGSLKDIIYRFRQFEAGIVFSAEPFCWPDGKLADKYPVTESKYKYLNSGGFIGYAPEIFNFITEDAVPNDFDDQLFYTRLFLDNSIREKYRIKLDYKANIFQNLQGALEDVELRFDDEFSYLENTKYGTVPIVVHGNGLSKDSLNTVGNYVAKSWTEADDCISCSENKIELPESEDNYPDVLLAVFITQPTPFIDSFFNRIQSLEYPDKKLHLFIYNSVPYHSEVVEHFTENAFLKYTSLKQILPADNIAELEARTLAVKQCQKKNCSYYFMLDSLTHLDNPKTLKRLIEQNRGVIAPLVIRPFKAWSNFWGALTKDGYYQRSFDYMSIVNSERRGLWNVPYISCVYLINANLFKIALPKYTHDSLDPDMAFCKNYREKGIFMYVDNTVDYGHLVDPETFDITRKHPDMYELISNKYDWEQRYIHPDYFLNLNPNTTVQQPCPDVYWFPVVTPRFCTELIEVVENFGKWSAGTNQDDRLIGGYENVPTRDIHMNQVGYEPAWLEFLHQYVRPMQEKIFTGYFHDPPRSLMNFVVRYRPDEQPQLRPHHDSSTYTINIALNRPKLDYEGGGCRFIRYNCSVTETKIGWMLMHPGRLTHFHEGLLVTKGTRYIMISFVDP